MGGGGELQGVMTSWGGGGTGSDGVGGEVDGWE